MATNEELQAAAETVSQLADDLDATKTMTFGSGDVAAMRTLAQHYISHPQPATDEQLAELKRLCAAEYTGTGSWKLADGSRLCDAGLLLRIKDAVPEIIARLEQLTGERDRQYEDNVCRIAAEGKACNERDAIAARMERAEAELKLWRPMTPEEIEDELENVESVPISDEKIAEMVEKITDPLYRPTEPEYVTLLVKVKQLQAEVERLRKELDRVYLRMVEADQMPLMMKPLAFTAIRMDLASAIAAQQEERNG